jgi:hypothetical protein
MKEAFGFLLVFFFAAFLVVFFLAAFFVVFFFAAFLVVFFLAAFLVVFFLATFFLVAFLATFFLAAFFVVFFFAAFFCCFLLGSFLLCGFLLFRHLSPPKNVFCELPKSLHSLMILTANTLSKEKCKKNHFSSECRFRFSLLPTIKSCRIRVLKR